MQQAQVEAQSWPMAPRQCQQCLTDQVKPRGMVQMETKEGEVVRPPLQPINPRRNGALGQLSDGAVQPVSPGGGGEQPQGEGEGWIQGSSN